VNPRLSRHCLEALVILALGVLIGLSVNYRLVLDAFSGRIEPPGQTARQGGAGVRQATPVPIDLAGVKEELQNGALLVDARIPELFAEGHLPGAVSLPLAEFARRLPTFREHVPEDRPLITYCNGYGCPDSYDLAVLLLEAGYRRVWVFEGGFPAWRDAGLPAKRGGGQ
jgi:rhodanese-related sulfurtransferase